MKCIYCAGPVRVLATRTRQEYLKVRRYECANDKAHRFSTYETLETVIKGVGKRFTERLERSTNGAAKRAANAAKNNKAKELLAQQWKPAAVAHEVGLSVRHVERLRKGRA